MTGVSRRLITEAVLTRLKTQPAKVYDGEIQPDLAPGMMPDTQRTEPYVVLYAFGGRAGVDPDLGDSGAGLVYSCQVSLVAAYRADCEYLTDTIDALMNRWVPSVSGIVFGSFRPPPGFDPGPIRPDVSIVPPRYSIALQYLIPATAN